MENTLAALQRYELISAHSRDIILHIAYDTGRILEANAAAVAAYGYSREELLNLTIRDLREPRTLDRVADQMEAAERQGVLFQTTHRRKDGSTFFVEVNSQGATIGGILTLVSVIRDISEHKAAEKTLRDSEARFRLLADTAAQLLAAEDPQDQINAIAHRVMEHLDCQCFIHFRLTDEPAGGLRLNAWAGIPAEEARRIEWLDIGVGVCGCVVRDGARIVAEHIPTTPDPRTEQLKSYGIKAYACHPLMDANGRIYGTLLFGTLSRETFSAEDLDLMKAVSDQIAGALVRSQHQKDLQRSADALHQANESLEENVRRRTSELENSLAALRNEIVVRTKIQTQLHQLSRVFMEAADPIIIEDLEGKVIQMNHEAETVYGWSREELVGQSVNAIFLPERLHLAAQVRERCRRGEEIRNYEGVRKAKSGRVIPVLLTAFPLTDQSGDVAFVATICKDLSAQKEMEAQLHDAHRHLRELSRKSLEALETDRRNVSRELHDSIGGSLAAIKWGLEGVAEQALRGTVCAPKALATLVAHLADTIKETKRISANLRPLSLDDLGLLSTIEWYTRQFRQRYANIRVICQIDVAEAEIPEEFKIVIYRVLQEALTNVARHSRADTVCIRLSKSASHFEFAVEDNGCGFEASEASSRLDGMSGFGLKSMQERAEISGGVLNLHSRPGGGTSVRVTLPFSPALSGYI